MADRVEECILLGYGTVSTYHLMTKKTRSILIARDVKFEEASLGLCDVKNHYEPLLLKYEDQENSSAREEDKISAGTVMGAKPAAGVTSSARLQDMRKPKEREDKSLDDLFEIETYSDECWTRVSQVYKPTSGPSRGSSSKMLPESSSYHTWSTVEEWALGVSQGDEPQSFSDAVKGTEEKEWR